DEHKIYLLGEFAEDYLENRMSRRDLLRRALLVTGSVPLAATSLLALGCGDSDSDTEPTPGATNAPPTPAPSPTGSGTAPGVPENDPALTAQAVTYPGPAGELKGYLAQPRTGGPFPAVLVIHENRGLVDHTRDVVRRYAKEGFVALAVDMASRGGGSTADTQQNLGLLNQVSAEDHVKDLQAGLDYLKTQSFVKAGSLGVTGFCYGGGFTFDLTAASPDIKAGVPYYGTAARALNNGLDRTKAAVLVMYGGTDARITGERERVEAALKTAATTYEIKVYDGAGHAFFNDTGGAYNETAAKDAWTETLSWFREHLA
ncbi:MAG TPA: dienelactone hydrolase family protein, partial [Dehalococcoidia bacterium]|nr:dienelactone hydrolase family protein [Dehalococcoidia bacterium]